VTSKPSEPERFVEAARSMIGCPFLLYGRNPATGLDCIGLVAACLAAIGREPAPPSGYRLRNRRIEPWLSCAQHSGFEIVSIPPLPGDIALVSPAAGQHHLVVIENARAMIHAHAGLRRVVREPISGGFTPIIHWRLGPRQGA
jgi:cell wall-associated NlpC family hydrolase